MTSGADETHQHTRVRVAHEWVKESGFVQLDSDVEKEFYVVSRMTGTGPYYALQLLDFSCYGMRVWRYPSAGKPEIERGVIRLGYLPDGYQGAATGRVLRSYQLGLDGLKPTAEE